MIQLTFDTSQAVQTLEKCEQLQIKQLQQQLIATIIHRKIDVWRLETVLLHCMDKPDQITAYEDCGGATRKLMGKTTVCLRQSDSSAIYVVIFLIIVQR